MHMCVQVIHRRSGACPHVWLISQWLACTKETSVDLCVSNVLNIRKCLIQHCFLLLNVRQVLGWLSRLFLYMRPQDSISDWAYWVILTRPIRCCCFYTLVVTPRMTPVSLNPDLYILWNKVAVLKMVQNSRQSSKIFIKRELELTKKIIGTFFLFLLLFFSFTYKVLVLSGTLYYCYYNTTPVA